MNLFDKLVEEALRNQPKSSNLRPVVEKELLHHDILKTLNENGILKDLTFMGGTALRACYGGIRLSEDLDFTAGKDFSRYSLSQVSDAITQNIYKKYGFETTVSTPQKDSGNVYTWKIKIITRPKQKNLPAQRINIDICSLLSYERRPMLLINPYGVDMGTSGLIIQVQSLEEIYTDKIIAFALRPRIKYRDLWDIMWLKQKGIVPKIELLPIKLKDRNCNIENFLDLVDGRMGSLKDTENMEEFRQEMQRFLPQNHLSIIAQKEILPMIANLISETSTSLKFLLVKAAYVGDINLVKQLIDVGMDVNRQNPYDEKTALHWAGTYVGCGGYQYGILKLLLEAGADVNIRDKENHTPLYYAAQNSMSVEAIRDLSARADYSNIKKALEAAQFGDMNDSRAEIVSYLSKL